MTVTDYRCSVAARARGDDLAGTASVVRAFLLLEEPGPWGRNAWRDARLPDGLGAEVLRRASAAGVRPLLVRRAGRTSGTRRQVIAAYVRAGGPSLVEAGEVTDPRAVLDLDLEALGQGASAGLDDRDEPVFAVCIHGRHDACCVERGRPVLDALAEAEPEAAWGVSHIGGDRFAANLLVLGEGLYYGGLDPDSARHVVHEHRAGRIDLEHLRGRSCWAMPVQAAEITLRRHLGLRDLGGIRVLHREHDGDLVTVTFTHDDARWRVAVRAVRTEPVRLTCAVERLQVPGRWVGESVAPD